MEKGVLLAKMCGACGLSKTWHSSSGVKQGAEQMFPITHRFHSHCHQSDKPAQSSGSPVTPPRVRVPTQVSLGDNHLLSRCCKGWARPSWLSRYPLVHNRLFDISYKKRSVWMPLFWVTRLYSKFWLNPSFPCVMNSSYLSHSLK